MSGLSVLRGTDGREEKFFRDIGETTVCSALAYLGAKTLTVINPISAAVFMGSVWGINKIANRIFKRSPNINKIVLAISIGSIVVVAYSVGITFFNGLLIVGITTLALGSLKYLHRNIL
ncbi:MAG: hypothetical protein K1060chlam4_00155 [Candidatus Anoxychlamydiales bacterium]|nr:hypothetical protein [Candidatus Anoxychlamydiales bacterium]